MSNSSNATPCRKPEPPAKPRKDFPLFPHRCGMWAKKIRGKVVYFTSWRQDPTGAAALEEFEREWPYLKKGETPPPIDVGDGLTVQALVNDFLETKEEAVKSGDLQKSTFTQYYRACENLIDHFGKQRKVADLVPADFRIYRAKLTKGKGPVAVKNAVNLARIIFNYAYDSCLTDKPVRYGKCFEHPTELALQSDKNKAGEKIFTREELHRILNALDGNVDAKIGKAVWRRDPAMKAMAMLGLNCAFGNSDVGALRESHIDGDWLTMPRVKTAIPRRIPLWPETLQAIKEALAVRPEPADESAKGLLFLTRLGQPWIRTTVKVIEEDGKDAHEIFASADALSGQFSKLLKRLGINGRRRLNFYCLRHVFETEAGNCRDQVAVDAVMGHKTPGMGTNYRHGIADDRLRDVVAVMRAWLFGDAKKGGCENG